jgi:hypothetical protein
MISEGENLGLTKTRTRKSVRNMVKTYLMGIKLFLKRMNIKEMKVAKNSIPADALISLSFNTGMLYPATFSPNCIILLISVVFWGFLVQEYQIKENGGTFRQRTAGYRRQTTSAGQSRICLYLFY